MEFFKTAEEWLEHHGFKNGSHPFESLAAEDDPRLEDYFEQFTYFDSIEKSRTTFLFLPRGSGKSANRVFLAKRCEDTLEKLENIESSDDKNKKNNDDNGILLPVIYTDFHRLISKKDITLKDHVDGILREAVPKLFETAVKYKRLKYLSQDTRQDFVWFLLNYPERLYSEHVKKQVLKIKGWSKKNKKEFAGKLVKIPAKFFDRYLPGIGLLSDAFSAFASTQVNIGDIPKIQRSPLELMECLREIAGEMGISKIHVFIDRIDEYCEIHDAEKAARMIRPLVETIPLLEMPGFVFKFFLPLEYRSQLLSNLRSDRLDIYTFEWKDNDLKKVFENRLNAYCDETELPDESGRKSFTRLFHNPPDDIVREMLRYADKSPRNLLKLAKKIIDEHTRSTEVGTGETPGPGSEDTGIRKKISMETYRRALAVFAREQIEWRALRNPDIAILGKFDLSARKPLEILLEEDMNIPSAKKSVEKWRKEHHFETTHFNLTDVIRFMNIPKTQAREIVNKLEDAGIITSHYRIVDKGLATYVHTKKGE